MAHTQAPTPGTPVPAHVREAQAREARMRPQLENLCWQYRRGFVTADELLREIAEELEYDRVRNRGTTAS